MFTSTPAKIEFKVTKRGDAFLLVTVCSSGITVEVPLTNSIEKELANAGVPVYDRRGNQINKPKETKEIAIFWSVDDVLNVAKNEEIDLSRDEASIILDDLKDTHDCNFGITWDSISGIIYDRRKDERE